MPELPKTAAAAAAAPPPPPPTTTTKTAATSEIIPMSGRPSPRPQDPLESLLHQELEREVEAAWKAYEALAQIAWETRAPTL